MTAATATSPAYTITVSTDRLRRDLLSNVYFRYAVGAVLISFFLFLRDYLPFPYPDLAIVVLAYLCVNFLLHIVLLTPAVGSLSYRVNAYVDTAFAIPILHTTGGFLSPFLISNYITALGCVFTQEFNSTDRRRGASVVAAFVLFYVLISLAQKFGYVENAVDYSNAMMQNGPFFYLVLLSISSIMLGGFFLIAHLRENVSTNLRELLHAYEHVVDGVVAQPGDGLFHELCKRLARAMGSDGAFIGSLDESGKWLSFYSVWAREQQHHISPVLIKGTLLEQLITDGHLIWPRGVSQLPQRSQLLEFLNADSVHAQALRETSGSVIGVIGAAHTGTMEEQYSRLAALRVFAVRCTEEIERRRMQLRAHEIEMTLVHSQKMETVGQLARGVAHDFNNTLNAIMGYLQLIQRKLPEDATIARYVPTMLDVCHHSAQVVHELLTFSRKGRECTEAVDMHDVIRHCADLLPHVIDKSITISAQTEATESTILGDREQLSGMLMNLCLNARDAMPEGGDLLIRTSSTLVESPQRQWRKEQFDITPGRFVAIEVKDNGCGMSEQTLEKLFEPFFTTKEVGHGTGLGLAAVYGCVRAHVGFLDVRSAPGSGTSFHVYLPLLHSEAPQSATASGHSGTRVMVVDDDDTVVESFIAALKAKGYEAAGFETAELAHSHFTQHSDTFGVAILDYSLPDCDGGQLMKRLLQIAPALRVVVVSGVISQEQAAELLASGASKVLHKPLLPMDLQKHIGELLPL